MNRRCSVPSPLMYGVFVNLIAAAIWLDLLRYPDGESVRPMGQVGMTFLLVIIAAAALIPHSVFFMIRTQRWFVGVVGMILALSHSSSRSLLLSGLSLSKG